MKSNALAAVGAIVALIGLGVGVRLLNQKPAIKPAIETARPAPEQPDREPTGLNRRNQAGFVSVVATENGEDSGPALRTGRITRMTTSTRTEDFDNQRERAMGSRNISGMVRARGNEGVTLVSGATVDIFENDPDTKNPPLRTVVSDEEGSFTITEINDQSMTYLAVARKDGFAPSVQRITLEDRTPRLFFFMTTGTQVSGLVLDAETSAPLSGATVSFPTQGEPMRMLGETKTDASGRWTFEDVPPGMVTSRAEKDGYADGNGRARSGREEMIIRLQAGAGVISGTGIARATKAPAVGAKMVLSMADGTRRSVLTDDEGKFEFRNLPAGEHSLVGTRRGIDTPRLPVKLDISQVVDGLEITLPDDLFVQGRVVKSPADAAFVGARVRFKGERGLESVLTDQDGAFAFQVATLDSYEIEVREKGWEPMIVQNGKNDSESTSTVLASDKLTRSLADATGASDRLVIRMKPTDTISGRVFIQQGTPGGPRAEGISRDQENQQTPARNANITVDAKIGDAMQRVVTRADANGEFFVNVSELGGKRTGDARVLASWGGAVGAANVRTNSTEPVEINLRNSRLQARLELSDGSPLSDVRVEMRSFIRSGNVDSADNAKLPPAIQYTRGRGDFAAGLVPGQPYSFKFELPDGKTIEKNYNNADQLLPRSLFIYDPVVNDIIVVKDDSRNRRQAGGPGGEGRRGGDRVQAGRGGDGGGQGNPGSGEGQRRIGPGGWGGGAGGTGGRGGRGGSVNP